MQTIFALALIGFLLLAAEAIVPGMILGISGIIALVASIWIGYAWYGPITGTWIFATIGILYSIGLLIWLKIFPWTTMGQRISNRTSLTSPLTAKGQMIGLQGTALSMLRPAGVAVIQGERRDVITDGSFIEPETPIIVIAEEGQQLIVKALNPNELPDQNKYKPNN